MRHVVDEKPHSQHGASSADRWLACPGSIRLSAGVHDPSSIFAAEGSAAHDLGERALRDGKDAIEYLGDEIVVGNHVFTVDEEMAEAVQVYLNEVRHILRPGDEFEIEQWFDLSSHIGEGVGGTGDACVYRPSTGELFIVDLKYGRGVAVDAEDNAQLMFYGLGAALARPRKGLSKVTMIIVQPRAAHKDGPVRRWTVDALAMSDFMDKLKEGVAATLTADASLVPGEHCRFCKAAAFCPALREEAMKAAQLEFAESPMDLTPEQKAAILEKADLIESWVKAVRSDAHATLDNGGVIPGWKLVQKRATRKWGDDPEFVAIGLKAIRPFTDDQLYDRKLKSPAQIEKLLPKAEKEALNALVIKESSGTTLAREADPREAVSGQGGALADFG